MDEHNHTGESSIDTLRRRARRRLVGAAVLALCAAIGLPLVFEKEPPPLADEVDIRIPSADKTPFDPEPLGTALGDKPGPKEAPKAAGVVLEKASDLPVTAGADTGAAKVGADSSAVPPVVAPTATQDTKAEIKTESVATTQSAAAPAATPTQAAAAPATDAPVDPDGPKAPPRTGDWVVQLVSVRDANAAAQTLARLRELGYKSAYREKIDVENGVVTRVRVGPYKEKDFAQKIRVALMNKNFEPTVVQIK